MSAARERSTVSPPNQLSHRSMPTKSFPSLTDESVATDAHQVPGELQFLVAAQKRAPLAGLQHWRKRSEEPYQSRRTGAAKQSEFHLEPTDRLAIREQQSLAAARLVAQAYRGSFWDTLARVAL